jgi:large subunit ribosomal protein L15
MLDRLKPSPGARHRPKRVGRGPGTGHQKTAGRGVKGQGTRTRTAARHFEGGQMPLTRRLPKRGFTNVHREPGEIVNVGDLSVYGDGASVDLAAMAETGVLRGAARRVKLLADGDAPQRISVRVHAASAAAKAKVEAAGGSVEVVG